MSITYSYRPKPLIMLLGGGILAALSAFYIYLTITNDRGLIINGIELDAYGAKVFYALLGAAFVLFFICVAAATIYGHLKKPLLALAEDHMIIPHGFIRKRPKIIYFADIRRITYQSVNGQRFLTIWSSGGKISIARSLLESEEVFEAVSTFIHDRTPQLSIG